MATALVGGAFLSASLQVLFDRLASRDFINIFRGRKQEERLLQKLKIKLLGVKPLLNDAELKQWTDSAVKDWVDELKDTIFHADDLLDEIATKAMQSKLDSEYPTTTTTTQTVSDLLGSWSPFAGDIASRIEEIIQKLEDFVDAKNSLGLREVVVGPNISSQRLPTSSLVDRVYGRDGDKDKIIQLLISDDDSSGPPVSVIPIVGMGGIGKTTLAQFVYNDPQVVDHFEERKWVCVSEEFDITRVTKTILDGLSVSFSSDADLDTLQVKLRGRLAEKKFLIVLDDVWNEKYENWDQLRLPFAAGKRGSKIIVTTRNKGVASIMQTVPIFDLGQLSNEDCWLLFSKHAFVNVSHSVQSSLEPIGRKIVEKCKGLPLAAKTLGGLLRYKVEVAEWVDVLNSDFWDLPKEKSDILPALLLSYHHLPSHLKLCFAFCAIFPEDYPFEKDELVRLWMAAGFVQQPRPRGRIEDIGDGYFRELISRSLFQQSSLDDHFLMHDLINDLARFVAGEYCLRLKDDHKLDISKVRYLSYYFGGGFDAVEILKAINEPNYIRILQLWIYSSLSQSVLLDVLPRLGCLRALSLNSCGIVELPDSIGNLIHLRHLDLSYSEKIVLLPDTICRLCNLETLLLRDCSSLTTLPELLCKLICLRNLDLRGTKLRDMPMQIGKLRSLQQLTNFVVGNQIGSTISELRELDYLRGTLSISNLQNVRHALEAILKNKEHLEKLNLEWVAEQTDDSQKEKEVLEKLQPHVNLKHLTIINYGGTRFPDWLGNRSFSKLKSLYLYKCTNCFELPSLGKLPSLQELTIKGMNMVGKVGSEFYGNDSSGIKPFQSLEKLRFEEMLGLEEWSMLGAGEFCHLLELCISNCPKLKAEFSMHFPITDPTTGGDHQSLSSQSEEEMKCVNTKFCSLEISNCPKLELPLSEETEHSYKFLQDFKITRGNCDSATEMFHQDVEIAERSCDSLTSFPLGFFPKLQSLEIDGCRNFESFSVIEGIQNLTSLQSLRISNCPNMVYFSEGGLPARNLTEITIDSCKKLKALPKQMSTLLPSLRSLYLIDLPELELLLYEDSEHEYKFLQNLRIVRSCDSLKYFPLGFFPNLCSLEITSCKNLESLSGLDGQQNLTSLQSLRISYCPNMVYFPEGGLPARNLTVITIDSCEKLKALPKQMSTLLPSLRSLDLKYLPELELLLYEDSEHQYKFLQNLTIDGSCDSLKYFPLGFFPNLRSLEIKGCKNLESFSGLDGQQNLTSLQSLEIRGCPKMVSFADGGGLPAPNLTSLTIGSCERLKALPEQMCTLLSSLEELYLWNLPEIESLPDEGLPSWLLRLSIWFCPLLEVRCQKEIGEDWLKISHIPYIRIDGEVIADRRFES